MREFDELRAAHRASVEAAFLSAFVLGIITGAAIVLLTVYFGGLA